MNILLTSAGRRSYLVKYFQEALKQAGEVHVANSSNISAAFNVADKSVVTPKIYDKNYIPFLKQYCLENKITAIISLFDVDLPILAKHKQEFKEMGVSIIVSDYDSVDICNDKWKTYKFLVENRINVPKTYISLDDAIESIKSNELSYPMIIKPRWGMGSIAVFEADNEEELRVLYNKTKNNILKTYLKYESLENINESVMIQEKLDGQEYGLDVINDLEGNYITTIPKMKYVMRSGETDCAVTVDNADLEKLGEKLSNSLNHIANLDVDVFAVENKYYVLEMNARFGGGYPFSHLAGINLPLAIVNWLNGIKVDKELFSQQLNIVGQKDINIIRLFDKMEKNYE